MKAKILISLVTLGSIVGGYGLWKMRPRDDFAHLAKYIYKPEPELATKQDEIAFLEARAAKSADAMGELALAYAGRARDAGDPALLDKAIELAQTSLKRMPNFNLSSRYALAEVHEARHEFEPALEYARQVLK